MRTALRAIALAAAAILSAAVTTVSADELCGCIICNCTPEDDTPATQMPRRHTDVVQRSFAWGVDAGGSIDMSANDMSSIDFAASFGFKSSWIKFFGVGAEIDIMLSNSARSFPVFASFKTNFRRGHSLVFVDLRGGMAANYLPNDYQQNGAYAYGGLGVNLARGNSYTSYLVLGYTFKQFHDITTRGGDIIPISDLHLASVRLGVTF